jgi:hypothetical protein
MGLFSRKQEPRVFTNAPRDWPAVTTTAWTGSAQVDLLMITSQLIPALTRQGGRVVSFLDRKLYDDGVLTIPMVVELNGPPTGVFIYPQVDATVESHFSAVRGLLRQREQMNAVFYAPAPLQPARPEGGLEPLDPNSFSAAPEDRAAAEYALFWPSAEDPRLAASAALGHLDRWFRALDGYTYVYFTLLVRALELDEQEDDGEPAVVGLPLQPLMVGISGPGSIQAYLHGSQERGLFLAVDTATPVVQRDRLLKHLADSAEAVREQALARRVPARDEDRGGLAAWLRAREEFLRREEAGAPDLRLGCISEAGSARVLAAGVSDAAERRSGRLEMGEPSEGLLDFVREQLDAAFAQVARNLDDAEGGPQLQPFLAARVGAQTWRTLLPYTVEPEAVAFAPQVMAEREDAAFAALLCDGYLRVQGERSDAVVVRAQERGAPASFVFAQRYRAEGGRVQTLGNWLLTGQDASLWPGGAPPSGAGPSPRLRAFAEDRLRSLLDWITTGDDSGAELYHERDALFSPSLEHLRDGRVNLSRFMMAGLSSALGGARETLARQGSGELAALLFDDATTVDGRHARSLRLWVHERGTPAGFLFAQAYEEPRAGRRFTTTGPFTLVRNVEGLFPAAQGLGS